LIDVHGLVKRYGTTVAVDGLDFHIEKGSIVGFLGPNGAGKTTTMKMITGALPSSSGEVEVGGHSVFKEPLVIKKMIGYLPETPPLYLDMKVRDYLRFATRLQGVSKAQVASKVDDAMERVKIQDVSHRLIHNLSKGYRQRVGLAQAIAHNPKVLVLDEPTDGLDPRQIIEIRELIKSLAGDHTVILSSHILPEVAATCERVLIINHGKIVADDTIEKIQKGSGGVASVRMRVQGMHESEVKDLEVVAGVDQASAEVDQATETTLFNIHFKMGEDGRARVSQWAFEKGFALLELRPEGTSLEDVFLNLTKDDQEHGAQA
jgi:ABC-2 type transport system ATP-binding protein